MLVGAGAATAATRTETRVKSGTGFAVSPFGHVVTGAHVVAGCRGVSVWARDGVQRSARIIAMDPVRDIALLQIGGALSDYARAPRSGELPLGEQVLALGYGVHVNNPRRPEATAGIYVGNDLTAAGIEVRVVRARLHRGNSGSAVVGTDGALLGMVIGRDTDRPDLGLVLPAFEIERFLRGHGVRLLPPGARGEAAPGRLLQEISTLVQCEPMLGEDC